MFFDHRDFERKSGAFRFATLTGEIAAVQLRDAMTKVKPQTRVGYISFPWDALPKLSE